MIYIAKYFTKIFSKNVFIFLAGKCDKDIADQAPGPGFRYPVIPRKALDGPYIGSMIDIGNVAKCR
jgi:hypothetical protein